MLTSRGVTAWRQALASVAPAATSPSPPASPHAAALPAWLAAELIHALAGLALTAPHP